MRCNAFNGFMSKGPFLFLLLCYTLYIEIHEVENQEMKDHAKVIKHLLYGFLIYFPTMNEVKFILTIIIIY